MDQPLNYPLSLQFKIIALAPQIRIRDASGTMLGYVKQKLFRLREAVTVFADEQQNQSLYQIKADRIIDFSARYNFSDYQGLPIGAVKRKGLRSLWKAHYEIFDGDQVVMSIREENGWIKIVDGLVGEIPIVGMFTGYLFHPAYLVLDANEQPLLRAEKQPAFFESEFKIEKLGHIDTEDQQRAILSLLMMTLLERGRG